jgi:tetrapyrrole methylase family protein / MazG family protein
VVEGQFHETNSAGPQLVNMTWSPYSNFFMKKKKSKRSTKKDRATRKSNSFTPPMAGADFQKLVAVMSRLRAPKGCPWDREQTHATLRTYLIEEAYEVLDALDSTDDAKFAEELGDLLLQVLFHAQIAHEEGRFDIRDVIREIYEKMIRRHPHVFGSVRAKTAADVLRNWEQIKMQERQAKSPAAGDSVNSVSVADDAAQPASILDGVPRTLPALLEALQLTRKAARIGFDWSTVDGIFDKLTEETQELQTVLGAEAKNASRIEGEVGDILFVTVNLARFLHVDPEIALKKTCAKFSRRFRTMERLAREQGTALPKVARPRMEAYWDQAKLLEESSTES